MKSNQICCIYKIVCLDATVKDYYIGATKHATRRQSQHKYNTNGGKESMKLLYKTIRNNGGWNNWEFKILEQFEFNREMLTLLERKYIRESMPSLNNSFGGYPSC